MILGVDIGTQSLKVVVTDDALVVRGQASVAYDVVYPRTAGGRAGWVEQRPEDWEAALCEAIGLAMANAGCCAVDISAVGIAGQLDGCVGVAGDGRPHTPCLIWMDRRASVEAQRFDLELTRQRSGVVVDPSHMAAKLLWLDAHHPGAVGFHQPVSYLVARLTGESVLDHAQASTTMLYDLQARDWSESTLASVKIDRAVLPRLADASAIAGAVTKRAAAWSGLVAGTPVVVGTGDDFATALGAGVIEAGVVSVGIGTAEVVGAVSHAAVLDDAALVQTHPYPTGAWFVENPGWMSGGAVAWIGRVLGIDSPHELDRLAGATPPGADGLSFVPALTGAMAPRWEASARGCFYGLTPAHGAGHLIRAVLEGCAFAMRDVITRLSALGLSAERLRLSGGGSQSALWAQIRADLMNLPVEVANVPDTCPIGAAMLAAVGTGQVADLATAAALAGGQPRTVTPRPANSPSYLGAYHRYRALFEALSPLY